MTVLVVAALFSLKQQTGYQLKSDEVTVTSIKLAVELIIFLIFVDIQDFVNAVTMGKVSQDQQSRNDFTKCLKACMQANGGHFQ